MTSKEYDRLRKLPSWRYRLVTENIYAKELNRIHPLKQRQVEAICKVASENKTIKRVIVFGSATTYLCSSYSDLDICIECVDGPYVDEIEYDLKIDVINFMKFAKEITRDTNGYDLMFWEELDGAIVEKSIKEKGIVVYEQSVFKK